MFDCIIWSAETGSLCIPHNTRTAVAVILSAPSSSIIASIICLVLINLRSVPSNVVAVAAVRRRQGSNFNSTKVFMALARRRLFSNLGFQMKLVACARAGNRWVWRDATIILMAYRHGLRVSELVGLCCSDINLDAQTIFIRRAKGSVSGGHPLTGDGEGVSDCVRHARQYGDATLCEWSGLGFLSRRFRAMVARVAISAFMNMIRRLSGIPGSFRLCRPSQVSMSAAIARSLQALRSSRPSTSFFATSRYSDCKSDWSSLWNCRQPSNRHKAGSEFMERSVCNVAASWNGFPGASAHPWFDLGSPSIAFWAI